MSHSGNAQKTGFSQSAIEQGFWPPPSGGPLRSRFHARSTDASLADPRHARIRSQARLDHRTAHLFGEQLRRQAELDATQRLMIVPGPLLVCVENALRNDSEG